MRGYELNSFKILSRRAMLVGAAKVGLLTTLLGRLYYLQVMQADKYLTLAEENRISIRLIPPIRGEILDRNGVPIATNRQNYQLILIPEQANGVEPTLDVLGKLIEVTPKQRERIMRDVARGRSFMPVTVRDTLNWEEVSTVEVNSYQLSGLMIEPGETRFYPFGGVTSHVVGYVGAVSEKELTGDKALELPEARVGKVGLEKTFERSIRGQAGTRQVEVNAYGRVIRELSREEGNPGDVLQTTIDIELQKYATERMGEESGSVVVMNVHTGEVVALVSTPSFDPHLFNFGLHPDQWKELNTNIKKPLINKSIAGEYVPGSTFKMVVALAALERGVLNPNNRVTCYGHIELGNHRFHCWRKHGHGPMNLKDAIAQSCDVYFYELAKKIGISAIADMARRLGYDKVTGVEIPGERKGVIPDPKWKRSRFQSDPNWHQGETLVAAIGQGYVVTTPVQQAVMIARIVNGGYAVEPTLLRKPADEKPKEFDKIKLNDTHLKWVKEAMDATVNEDRGTARSSTYNGGRYVFGGKTGTAQVRRITMAERQAGTYDPLNRPWKHRDHALFVGYAPYDDPKYAVSVIVEHGVSGSKAAAPVARDVLMKIIELEKERAENMPEPQAEEGQKNEL